jgi:hypothetical protein
LRDGESRFENRRMQMLQVALALAVTAAVPPAAARQPTAIEGPSPKGPYTDHAIGVYDARLERVVLIGSAGDPLPGQTDRVWSWTGSRWESVSESGPPGRVNAAAAYDAGRRRIVVTGGSRKSNGNSWEVVGDSWEGDRNGWRPMANIDPRDHQSLVENGDGVLMFGGIPAVRSGPWPHETLELQGDTWRRVATDGPAGRGRAAMVYDSKRKQVVLFGGVSAPSGADDRQTFLNDTWVWDGKRWKQVSDSGPRGRYAHGMVYDERRGVVLLYSGAAAHRDAPLSDMWQWDGTRWSEIPLTGSTPGHRYQPVMVYDKARGRTILYGGMGGMTDTWEWDGQRWQEITP